MRCVVGRFERQERIRPPILGPNEKYEWNVDGVMKDGALAASNACEEELNPDVNVNTCTAHMGVLWIDRHKSLLRDPLNETIIREDFESFKNIQFAEASDRTFDLMLQKWTIVLNENALATAFSVAWRGVSCTRAAVNKLAVVPGGLPSDNNGEEGKNAGQKRWQGWQKKAMVGYIPDVADYLQAVSRSDKEFGGKMNKAVNCCKFYSEVYKLATADFVFNCLL